MGADNPNRPRVVVTTLQSLEKLLSKARAHGALEDLQACVCVRVCVCAHVCVRMPASAYTRAHACVCSA